MAFNTVFNIMSVILKGPMQLAMLSWGSFCTVFFTSHRLLFHISIIETMGRGERRMSPVAKAKELEFSTSPLTPWRIILLFSCSNTKIAFTHSPICHFETVPNSKKLQTTTEMWLLKDFKIEIV